MRRSVLSVLVVWVLACAAHADRPLLPPPVTSAELEQYGEWLGLSDAQLQAWRHSLLEYQAAYREQRARLLEEIAPLRKELRDVPDLTPSHTAERYFMAHRQAMHRLFALDRSFLESIEPVLVDAQRELQPVLGARIRRIWMNDELIARWLWRAQLIEWRELLDAAGIDTAAHERIETIVREADTATLNDLPEFQSRIAMAILEWTRAMERVEHDPAEPDGISYSTRLHVYAEAAEPARQVFERLFDRQRQTLMRLIDTLPPEDGWALFREVLDRGLGGRIAVHFGQAQAIIERARALDLLEENADFERAMQRAILEYADEAMRMHYEWRTSHPPPLSASFDGRANFDVEEPRERLNAQVARLIGAFEREVAVELMQIWQGSERAARRSPEEITRSRIEQVRDDPAPDAFVPGPISSDALDSFIQAAGLSSDEVAILGALHEDYQRAFLRIRRDEINRVLATFVGWRMPEDAEDGFMRFSAPADVEEKYEARRQARRSIDALDQGFIDDVAAAVVGSGKQHAVSILRLARAGEAETRGVRAQVFVANDYVPYRACVVRAVNQANLSDASSARAYEVLAEHADTLTAVLRQLSAAELRLEHANNRMFAAVHHEPEKVEPFGRDRDEAVNGARRARMTVVRAAQTAVDAVAASLTESDAERLRDSYLRLAYPAVYIDEKAQHEAFRRALAQLDQGGPQLEEVGERWLEYRTGYEALSRRMAEVMARATHAGVMMDEEARREVDTINRRVEAIRLERDSLNEEAELFLRTAGPRPRD